MTTQWNYIRNGQSLGPVSEEQLKALLASGQLSWEDLVWREGMPAWTAARQVTELGPALNPAPTPAPSTPQPFRIQLDEPPVAAPKANPYSPPQANLQGASWGNTAQGAVSFEVVEALRETKPWTRLLAVLGFIGIGFMILASLGMLAVGSAAGSGLPRGFGVGLMLAYLAMAGLQLPAALFLNRYASRIGDLVSSQRPEDLRDALVAQKSFWRYVGLLSLILICLYAVGIIVVVVAAGMRAAH